MKLIALAITLSIFSFQSFADGLSHRTNRLEKKYERAEKKNQLNLEDHIASTEKALTVQQKLRANIGKNIGDELSLSLCAILKMEIVDAINQIDENVAVIKSLKDQMESLNQEINDLDLMKQKALRKPGLSNSQKSAIEYQFAKLTQDAQKQKDECEDKIKSLENQIGNLKEKINSLEHEMIQGKC